MTRIAGGSSAALLLPVLLVLGAFVGAAQAENWPAWRGPRADGVSTETDVPLEWSADRNVRWKTAIPGIGHSSPIVWEDAVFVTSADPESQSRWLYRLDRATGRIAWRQTVFVAPFEEMHNSNTPASATPATDGESVFVAFCNHDRLHVAALSFDDGHLVWEQAPGGFVSRHGFHTCPVLSKGRLFLSGQQDSDDAFVAMLDARTGRLAWKVPRGKAGRSFSTPFLFSAGGDEQLVLSGTEETIGYRTGDGSMLWRVDGPAEKTVSSLVVGRDLIFVAGGRDKRLFALRPADAGGGAEIVWQASKGIPYVSSPVLADGILHIVSDDGIYSRYRPEDGTLLLQKRLGDRTSSSLVAAAGRVYLTDETGRTTVVTSGARFEVLATNELSEGVRASLAVSNGELFIRGNRHLFCISDRDASDSRSGGAASSSRSQ